MESSIKEALKKCKSVNKSDEILDDLFNSIKVGNFTFCDMTQFSRRRKVGPMTGIVKQMEVTSLQMLIRKSIKKVRRKRKR